MTVRFLALYETPAGPEAFDRHYREVHIPLGRRLPGLRRPGGTAMFAGMGNEPSGVHPQARGDLACRRMRWIAFRGKVS